MKYLNTICKDVRRAGKGIPAPALFPVSVMGGGGRDWFQRLELYDLAVTDMPEPVAPAHISNVIDHLSNSLISWEMTVSVLYPMQVPFSAGMFAGSGSMVGQCSNMTVSVLRRLYENRKSFYSVAFMNIPRRMRDLLLVRERTEGRGDVPVSLGSGLTLWERRSPEVIDRNVNCYQQVFSGASGDMRVCRSWGAWNFYRSHESRDFTHLVQRTERILRGGVASAAAILPEGFGMEPGAGLEGGGLWPWPPERPTETEVSVKAVWQHNYPIWRKQRHTVQGGWLKLAEPSFVTVLTEALKAVPQNQLGEGGTAYLAGRTIVLRSYILGQALDVRSAFTGVKMLYMEPFSEYRAWRTDHVSKYVAGYKTHFFRLCSLLKEARFYGKTAAEKQPGTGTNNGDEDRNAGRSVRLIWPKGGILVTRGMQSNVQLVILGHPGDGDPLPVYISNKAIIRNRARPFDHTAADYMTDSFPINRGVPPAEGAWDADPFWTGSKHRRAETAARHPSGKQNRFVPRKGDRESTTNTFAVGIGQWAIFTLQQIGNKVLHSGNRFYFQWNIYRHRRFFSQLFRTANRERRQLIHTWLIHTQPIHTQLNIGEGQRFPFYMQVGRRSPTGREAGGFPSTFKAAMSTEQRTLPLPLHVGWNPVFPGETGYHSPQFVFTKPYQADSFYAAEEKREAQPRSLLASGSLHRQGRIKKLSHVAEDHLTFVKREENRYTDVSSDKKTQREIVNTPIRHGGESLLPMELPGDLSKASLEKLSLLLEEKESDLVRDGFLIPADEMAQSMSLRDMAVEYLQWAPPLVYGTPVETDKSREGGKTHRIIHHVAKPLPIWHKFSKSQGTVYQVNRMKYYHMRFHETDIRLTPEDRMEAPPRRGSRPQPFIPHSGSRPQPLILHSHSRQQPLIPGNSSRPQPFILHSHTEFLGTTSALSARAFRMQVAAAVSEPFTEKEHQIRQSTCPPPLIHQTVRASARLPQRESREDVGRKAANREAACKSEGHRKEDRGLSPGVLEKQVKEIVKKETEKAAVSAVLSQQISKSLDSMIDHHLSGIADRVYASIEQRLKQERNRRGI